MSAAGRAIRACSSHLDTKCFGPAILRQRQPHPHTASRQSVKGFIFCTVKLRITSVVLIHLLTVHRLVVLPHLGIFREALEIHASLWSLPSLHLSWLRRMNRELFTDKPKIKIWSPEANTAFKDLVRILPAAGLMNSQTLLLNSSANHFTLADQCFQPSSTDCY